MVLLATTGTSLPVITSVQDCADYAKVFAPYLPQLTALPNQVLNHLTDAPALQSLYASTNPAISGLAFSVALFPIFLVLSEINKNYSQVDRVWSILPTVYHIHYAVWARLNDIPTAKVDNVLAFSVVWSLRLTYNYWRKGGYEIGSEDYRWALIKEKIGQPWFFLLNVLFVSSLQSVLLWVVTTPTYLLLLASRLDPTMDIIELVVSRFLILLVVVEYFADGQMWDYQQAKQKYRKTAKVPQESKHTREQLDRGFITTGLWKYSRHPNFVAEQLIWVTLYAWGCYATGTYYNWTIVGVASYLGVFAGSTPLTEDISAGKYPEYKTYQQRVGKFFPKLFGKGWDEAEMTKEQGAKNK
ncbi:Protein of unknown function (DUF1295) [Teratosphaeria destructans]|uniref:DUF1295-domain-containing protein n=1 Tax=Teratosphaeria destructans TaxID=418781 RepID=A0A9W7W518_9PEZI|nr:Protein of unknown function (DUF1295) [Teratosphaeria destructans]